MSSVAVDLDLSIWIGPSEVVSDRLSDVIHPDFIIKTIQKRAPYFQLLLQFTRVNLWLISEKVKLCSDQKLLTNKPLLVFFSKMENLVNLLLMAFAMICVQETCLAASLGQQKRRIVKRDASAVSPVSTL